MAAPDWPTSDDRPDDTRIRRIYLAIKRLCGRVPSVARHSWRPARTPTAAEILASLSDKDRAWLRRWFVQNGGDPAAAIPDDKIVEWYLYDEWLFDQF
jgi:hypothetical protein